MQIVNKSLYRLIISFIFSFILFFQPYGGVTGAFALSTEEERILGETFLNQVRKNFDFVDDDFAQQYINELGHYLIRSLKTEYFTFHFYLVKDNDLNAFAGPGGHIFVFSGLINEMDEVDELAAVVAHEIAHVSARHLANRVEQNKKLGLATLAGLLAGLLMGGQAGAAVMAGTQAAAVQAQLHYSREDERQADQLGFKYTGEAGFDPAGLIGALKKIQKNQWIGTDKVPAYLLTHPTGPERMSNLDVMLRGYSQRPENSVAARFRALFPLFKTIVRAKSVDPHDAERVFNGELEKDPESVLANFGLGMVWKERSEYERALEHFQKALKGQPDSVPILRNLGETYQLKGQDAKALEVFESALKVNGQDRSTLFLVAVSYQNLERYREAAELYEKLVALGPVREEVFYNLGVSYGREGNLALAHCNFGIYFRRLGKGEKAKFHFQKALDLSKNDPALRARINKAMEGLN